MAASKGVWFDTKAGKVVESQPAEGIQLVAPGVEATPDEERRVEAFKAGVPAAGDEPQVTVSKSRK
jgi:hypothetical protein